MGEILGFVSLTGDMEKSNFLANLAVSLSLSDKRVLLVDLGCPFSTLDMLCGVAENVVYTALDVGMNKVSLSHAVLRIPVKEGRREVCDRLFLLPSSPLESWTEEQTCALLSSLRTEKAYDLTLVSFSHATCVRKGLDALFLLTGADDISLRAAEAWAADMGADAFLLMDYPTDWDSLCGITPPVSAIDRLGLPLLGIVPRLPTGGLMGILDGTARARNYLCAVRNVASRFLGKSTPLLSGVALVGIDRRQLLAREG